MQKILIFIFTLILLFFFNCMVNDSTALIRVENMGSEAITNVKIGNTLIVSYLNKGAVYDYWAVNWFEGIIFMEGATSNYTKDVHLKIKPKWQYIIFVTNDEEDENIWSVAVDKQGEGEDDEKEVKEFD